MAVRIPTRRLLTRTCMALALPNLIHTALHAQQQAPTSTATDPSTAASETTLPAVEMWL